ncbi:putative polysaccharide biosynthesis protein [Bacillus kwashiorkori]|uniref:putative polysaccharide biosynthesis protein n=1 Tax=Bacillus kwashiorkori TaxID=1522318 RepID=UPI0007834D17|nr:polysaccharide biosynthesis protein [Bacillus kwashiorkori]
MKQLSNSKSTVLIKGTVILSLAAMLTKVLSVLYRVPFQNIVGDIGFYIYQQVYPFYGVAITIGTVGFPVIISKLLAERLNNGSYTKAREMLVAAFLTIFFITLLIFLSVFFFADRIAQKMGDENLVPLLQTVAFSFLLVPFLSILRGFFQGQSFMVPTAFSQIGEQLIRVTVILFSAILLMRQGAGLYKVGQAAIFASIIGSVIGFIILCLFFFHNRQHSQITSWSWKDVGTTVRQIFIQGFAVCVSGLMLILFQMSDAFQIVPTLLETGINSLEAKTIKGIFDRGQPLLQMGTVLATSLSLSLVPIISAKKIQGLEKEVDYYIKLALQISIAIGAASSLGLILIMETFNMMLFENSKGTFVLQIFMVAIFFTTINITLTAILQGLGVVIYPSIAVLVGLFVKIALNEFFIEKWQIIGAPLATNSGLFVITLLLIWKLKQKTKANYITWRFTFITIKALLIMTIAVLLSFFFLQGIEKYFSNVRIYAIVITIFAVIIGSLTFLISFIRSEVFTRAELMTLPLGDKLEKLYPRKK